MITLTNIINTPMAVSVRKLCPMGADHNVTLKHYRAFSQYNNIRITAYGGSASLQTFKNWVTNLKE